MWFVLNKYLLFKFSALHKVDFNTYVVTRLSLSVSSSMLTFAGAIGLENGCSAVPNKNTNSEHELVTYKLQLLILYHLYQLLPFLIYINKDITGQYRQEPGTMSIYHCAQNTNQATECNLNKFNILMQLNLIEE